MSRADAAPRDGFSADVTWSDTRLIARA